jgi:hypothetical protein
MQKGDPRPQPPHSCLPKGSSSGFLMNSFPTPKNQTYPHLFQRLPGKLCPKSPTRDENLCLPFKNPIHRIFSRMKLLLSFPQPYSQLDLPEKPHWIESP